ncbi:3-oxoacyl-[acyl-carrier protein] reductase/enoyl-[acyl-carrier protein] reductase III [Lentzea fradiae]|uniref:3-oxoacyl-[acyl-carrier protein] reductase/enoyl-[acyl-carrier protein] reductase III n=1 Tax=Lentzea fradiae TaxID=200378 RepID=A0A1G8CY54_9PSEU|nr:SDR family oxidoreductase [Lentzea fradiae]SDH50448.1 3-oxoacyl-[acyl-carrier protein] reductase/enoyl-[acyl-carrier protein] reductase III [Lentzea fradiae]
MIEPVNTRLGLDGKIALVTSGTHGLGLAIASKLCDNGAHVIITTSDDDVDLERAKTVLAGKPGSVAITQLDIHDEHAVRTLLDRVKEERGQLDVFVHHAESPDLTPLLNIVEPLAKSLQDGGRVVIAGYTVTPVHGVIRTLALEMAWYKVAVNAVVTTVVDNGPMNIDPEMVDRLAIKSPSGRVTLPHDVANAVALLCTDEAAWIQGQVITVDGGLELLERWGETR